MKQEIRDGSEYASIHVLVKPATARKLSHLLDGKRNRDAFVIRSIADYAGAMAGMDGCTFVHPKASNLSPFSITCEGKEIRFIKTPSPENELLFSIDTIGDTLGIINRLIRMIEAKEHEVRLGMVILEGETYIDTDVMRRIFADIGKHTPLKDRKRICEGLYFTLCLCESVIVADPNDYEIDYTRAIIGGL